MAQNRKSETPNGWNEYKRLVLRELERLTQATQELRDQNTLSEKETQNKLNKLRDDIHKRIGDKHKETISDAKKLLSDFKKELADLEKQFNIYKKEQRKDTTITSKWGFWAAVISIIGTLIISIISLFKSLHP